MDATNPAEKTHAPPYGVVGLCLSVVAAIILALCLMGVGAGLTYFAVVGLRGGSAARMAVDGALAALQTGGEFSAARLALGLIFYVAALVALVLIALWRGGRHWRELIAWRPPVWPLRDKVLWGLAALGLIYGLGSSAALGYFYPKSNTWLLLPRDHLAVALLFVVAVVMAPVAEETYFRGWIFTGLRARWGLWPAMIVSSLLFALAHYESTHLYALAVFPLGLILAALRARTGSARTSMVFHAVNNLIAFLSAGVGGS